MLLFRAMLFRGVDCKRALLTKVVMLVFSMLVRWSVTEEDPPLVCHHQNCQYYRESYGGLYYYLIDGKVIDFMLSQELAPKDKRFTSMIMNCDGADVLESSALPRANVTMYLHWVSLHDCPLPSKASLADALHMLNVNLRSDRATKRFTLTSHGLGLALLQLPPRPPLSDSHFTGLEALERLVIIASQYTDKVPKRGFLAPLKSLEMLEIRNIMLNKDDLDLISQKLNDLHLSNVKVEQLPKVLCSLKSLREVLVESTRELNVAGVGPAMQNLKLKSPATTLQINDTSMLQLLDLTNWTEWYPTSLAHCKWLQTIQLNAPALRALPENWLINCTQLTHLQVQNARFLSTLPQRLVNANTLMFLSFSHGALKSLPQKFLHDAPNLHTLKLDSNRFLSLSSSTYLPLTLKTVNISSNNLDSDALVPFASLGHLVKLDLSDNPRIGDLCNETSFDSPMHKSKNMTFLSLKNTGLTRICKDWRKKMMLLKKLDLSRTNITVLSYEDLQFTRTVKRATVLLVGVPVTVVGMTRDQFYDIANRSLAPTSKASVRLDANLSCDCRMYWMRCALEFIKLDHVTGLHCFSGGDPRDLQPEEYVCNANDECALFEQLPPACACTWRPDSQSLTDRRLVHVNCTGTGLRRVPRLFASVSPPRNYHLLLPNNNIDYLNASDLNDNIKVLDLRNNSLNGVDRETAVALGNVDRLRIAGNPLECDCNAAPLLLTLHRLVDTDMINATCLDGSSLHNASIVECVTTPTANITSLPKSASSAPSGSLIAGLASLVVFLVLVLVGVISLMSRERRFFVRAVLNRWGCLWRGAEPVVDDTRPYDAFLTFSHADESVACEVVAQLEPRYRLCVHYRDWEPGQLITSQIVESVDRSRRTVALVSRHFLASTWARAEFREAHAAALRDSNTHRLVVVLLEEPDALPLDTQLRRYIGTNTYLRWGDPWFWDKIKVALPPPRTPLETHSDPSVRLRLLSMPALCMAPAASPPPSILQTAPIISFPTSPEPVSEDISVIPGSSTSPALIRSSLSSPVRTSMEQPPTDI